MHIFQIDLFLCLPCLLPPFTVPCKMVLARPDEPETCPYHCNMHLFLMVRRSSCGPIAYWILAWTSSLVTWSFYEMCSIFGQRMSYPPCADPFSYEDFYRWPFQCFQVKYQILYLVRILKYVDLLQLLAFNPPARVHRRQWNRRLVIYFGQIRLDSDTIVHKFESSENVKTNFPWLWVHFFQAQQKT